MSTRFKGYAGKMLDIDLSAGTVGEYGVTDEDRELFVGGRFLSTKILWDQLPRGVDPLGPENILIIMTSPLTGTGAPSSSRFDISAKSPQTGGIGHSNSGGNFGIHLKRAGWDGVLVRGRAEKPVYIEIVDDRVEIRSAEELWGMNTERVQEALKQGPMKKGAALGIGPAGENLVKFATIACQERVHGRTGMGAVMGSKRLKGMVVKGSKKIEVHRPEAFKKTTKKWIQLIKNHPGAGEQLRKYGTGVFLNLLSAANALPTKNFRNQGQWEHADKISGQSLAKNYLIKNYGCQSCPMKCGRVVEIDGKERKGPEYEILCLFGSNILNTDMQNIIRWNYAMDMIGIDGVSTGTILGFAAELNEKGLWNNGIEFGKVDNILQLIEAIGNREGIGNELAEGVKFLSEKYGGEDFAPHAKGLELPAYEPRAAVGHGLGYATANRGGCHLDGGYMVIMEASGPAKLDRFHTKSKPTYTILQQNFLAAIGAAGSCLFTSFTLLPAFCYKVPGNKRLERFVTVLLTSTWRLIKAFISAPPALLRFHIPLAPHSKALHEATGMDMDWGKFYLLGQRGYTMEKLFNLREGLGKKNDTLSKRFTDDPLIEGNAKSVVRLDQMLPKYYKLRGWDVDGIPTRRSLKKLGLTFVRLEEL